MYLNFVKNYLSKLARSNEKKLQAQLEIYCSDVNGFKKCYIVAKAQK
jgi:hypothetical protein